MKLSAIIPARISSKRLPRKVLKKINGIPMIEHVRRKAVSSNMFQEVKIVTSDLKIRKMYKGQSFLNKKKHFSGTSRATEIVNKIKGDIIVILFADELLISENQIKKYCTKIKKDKKSECWNATTTLNKKDLKSNDIVKCLIDKNNYITDFSRKKIGSSSDKKILKSVGIISFKKNFLKKYSYLKQSINEKENKIEQYRILDNNYKIKSVFLEKVYNSINSINDFNNASKLLKKIK
tara:strand:+ start:3050 stop:3757 length:708 start_codon:yes stop_codon:yes gene_type:complete